MLWRSDVEWEGSGGVDLKRQRSPQPQTLALPHPHPTLPYSSRSPMAPRYDPNRASHDTKNMRLGQMDGNLIHFVFCCEGGQKSAEKKWKSSPKSDLNCGLGPVDWSKLDVLWDRCFGRGKGEIHLVSWFVDFLGPTRKWIWWPLAQNLITRICLTL